LFALVSRRLQSEDSMPPDPEPDGRFGAELRATRKAAGLSLDRLADEMKARGYKITGANIGGWERGEHSPKSREPVAMLEDILGVTDQRLHDAMGWRAAEDPPVIEMLNDLTAEVRQLAQQLRKHLRDHGPGAP
jgi:transcriptional regulator with XRE-family HTH domain